MPKENVSSSVSLTDELSSSDSEELKISRSLDLFCFFFACSDLQTKKSLILSLILSQTPKRSPAAISGIYVYSHASCL